jgi:glycosyltransferase involved in cell wall biosynthesis
LDGRAPLVTIGMPTYNGAKHLAQSLDSLLAQDYPNCELLISDNCSTDETEEIARGYAARFERVHYLRHETNRGAAANFNHVLGRARGTYFMWAADHDLWATTFVSRCVALLEENPKSVLAHSETMLTSMDGRPIEVMDDRIELKDESALSRYERLIWNIGACNMVYGVSRTEPFRRAGGFADVFGPDLLLLARLVLEGTVERIEEPLYFRRQNRAEATSEEERVRILVDLNPAAAAERSRVSYEHQMRELRDAHLEALKSATALSARERLEAAVATLACYRRRFGVRSRLVTLLFPVTRTPPLRSWVRRPSNGSQPG